MREKLQRNDADLDQSREAAAPAMHDEDRRAPSRRGSAAQFRELGGMERSFGADFSGVRVHQDGRAAELGAQAFTQGDDIHLAPGRGDPSSHEGRALLGHELAHVVQQREGRVATQTVQGKGAPVVEDAGLEAEADVAGAAAARGEEVPEVSRARGGAGGGATAQAKAEGAPIQMFNSYDEHKKATDEGSGGRQYVWADDGSGKGTMEATVAGKPQPGAAPHFEFRLTQGDLAMLSGDLFDPREGHPAPHKYDDSLFALAAHPSKHPGKELGTQDEIIYAIYVENMEVHKEDPKKWPIDARFQSGGIWEKYPALFDKDKLEVARKARYNSMAAKNYEHFSRPVDGAKSIGGDGDSGQGSYRAQHENAIRLAYEAGRAGKDGGNAYVREGAAEHFLTDAFSAGHIRTPRKSVNDYWRARYPNFFHAFLKFMEDKIVEGLQGTATGIGNLVPEGVRRDGVHVGPVQKDGAHQKILAKLKGVPEINFGDMMGKILHDVDNENGIWVTNDLGHSWRAYGDGQMGSHGTTEKSTALAVKLGTADIDTAHALGLADAKGTAKTAAEVYAAVKASPASPANANPDKYGPEQAIPRVDTNHAKQNGVQEWTASSFEDLWNLPVRDDLPAETYGKRILEAMKPPGGAFYSQLNNIGSSLDNDGGFGLHPKDAFYHYFLTPFTHVPRQWLIEILKNAK